MGTPEFAVPTLIGIVREGHSVVAVYTRIPKPGGPRGLELKEDPGPSDGAILRNSRLYAGHAQERRRTGRFPRACRRCCNSCRLWASAANANLGCPEGRLSERTRLVAATLARRGAHSARDYCGRPGDRRGPDAYRERARHRTRRLAGSGPDSPRPHGGRYNTNPCGNRGQTGSPRFTSDGPWIPGVSETVGYRRMLRAKNRQGRGRNRLEARRHAGSQPHPRAVADAWRLLQCTNWRSVGAREDFEGRDFSLERRTWKDH